MNNVFVCFVNVAVVLCLLAIGLLAGRQKVTSWTPPFIITVLALSAMMGFFVSLVSEPSLLFSDFRVAYYRAGVAVLNSPAALGPEIAKDLGFVNLPILAYMFAPFGLFSLPVAAGLFTILGLVSVAAAGFLMIKLASVKGYDRLVLLFLITTNGPLIYTLKEGNTSQFVLLGLVAALWLLRKRKRWAAGALLAAMALIKLPLLLFGPYLLFRRNWPAVAGFVVVCGFAGVLSVAIFGWDMHVTWFDTAVLRFRDHILSAYNTQSVQSFLIRLREPPPPLLNWTTSDVSTTQRHVVLLLTIFLYLVAVLACIKGSISHGHFRSESDHARLDTEYALVVCLAVVSSPLSWSHYYCWLLLPISLFLGSQAILRSSSLVNWLRWTGTIMVMPVVVGLQFSDPIVMAYYTKLGVSSYLIGGLIWFSTLAWSLVSRPKEVDEETLRNRSEITTLTAPS